MDFLRKNSFALIIVVLAFTGEYFHTLFEGIEHSTFINKAGFEQTLYWNEMVYHVLNEFFSLFILFTLAIKINNKESKVLLWGVVCWYLIEFIEIILMMLKISTARMFINDGSWIQLFTCFFMMCFAFYGFTRYKY